MFYTSIFPMEEDWEELVSLNPGHLNLDLGNRRD